MEPQKNGWTIYLSGDKKKWRVLQSLSKPRWSFLHRASLPVILELLFETFRRHLSVEPLCIFAIIVNHVVISDPLHLTILRIAQLAINRWSPPVCRGIECTLANAGCPSPLTSSGPKVTESSDEGCTGPIDFHKPASGGPVISIP